MRHHPPETDTAPRLAPFARRSLSRILNTSIAMLVAIGTAGCLSPIPPADDSPVDAGPSMDANEREPGGLRIGFELDMQVPGLAGEISVERVELFLGSVRVTGDGAGGDDASTIGDTVLVWDTNSAPGQALLPDAPIGLYSNLLASVRWVTISGTLANDDDLVPFEMTTNLQSPLAVTVPMNGISVEPGITSEIACRLSLQSVLLQLDTDTLVADGNGVMRLPDDGAVLANQLAGALVIVRR